MATLDYKATYDISRYGFLQERRPYIEVTKEKFGDIAHLIDNITRDGEAFRKMCTVVSRVPDVYTILEDDAKVLYSILTMIIHKWVWGCGVDNISHIIPFKIGYTWWHLCEYWHYPKVLTHASVDLFNWKFIDDTKEFSLDNITNCHTITGNHSESWFYLIMVAIEGVGGQAIKHIMNVYDELQGGRKIDKITYEVLQISDYMNSCVEIIKGILKDSLMVLTNVTLIIFQ